MSENQGNIFFKEAQLSIILKENRYLCTFNMSISYIEKKNQYSIPAFRIQNEHQELPTCTHKVKWLF